MKNAFAACEFRRQGLIDHFGLHRAVCWCGMFASLLLMFACVSMAAADEYWSAVEQSGHRVGHAHYERQRHDGQITTRDELLIHVRVGGLSQDMRIERESLERDDGTPLGYSLRVSAGASQLDASARVSGKELAVNRRIGQSVRRDRMPLPPGLLLRGALEQRIAQQDAERDWTLEFDELDLASLAYQRVRLRPDAPGIADPVRLRRDIDRNGHRLQSQLTWIPAEKRYVESWNLWGSTFVLRGTDRESALSPAESYDLLSDVSLASPYRIPGGARAGTIRYVFESTGGSALTLATTGEQEVRIHGSRTIVTICRDCGNEAAPAAAELNRYRRPTGWIQSDDPRIRALARQAPLRGSIDARMRALSHQVERHMTGAIDYLGYASALEALDSRSGDCGEFALLLAAVARASGIPTRVVAGLAYASRFSGRSDVFSPHMWVQSWDGTRWRSYDAGLGQFDSGHIALVVGDGAPTDFEGVTNTLHQMRMVEAGHIKTMPSAAPLR
ncbi:MAG: transglutaminase-like domain-containing protein [Tahibacter sp.]